MHLVGTCAARDGVVAATCDDRVIASAAIDQIVARTPPFECCGNPCIGRWDKADIIDRDAEVIFAPGAFELQPVGAVPGACHEVEGDRLEIRLVHIGRVDGGHKLTTPIHIQQVLIRPIEGQAAAVTDIEGQLISFTRDKPLHILADADIARRRLEIEPIGAIGRHLPITAVVMDINLVIGIGGCPAGDAARADKTIEGRGQARNILERAVHDLVQIARTRCAGTEIAEDGVVPVTACDGVIATIAEDLVCAFATVDDIVTVRCALRRGHLPCGRQCEKLHVVEADADIVLGATALELQTVAAVARPRHKRQGNGLEFRLADIARVDRRDELTAEEHIDHVLIRTVDRSQAFAVGHIEIELIAFAGNEVLDVLTDTDIARRPFQIEGVATVTGGLRGLGVDVVDLDPRIGVGRRPAGDRPDADKAERISCKARHILERPVDDQVDGLAAQHGAAIVAEDRVIAGTARDGVIAAISEDQVSAFATVDDIIAAIARVVERHESRVEIHVRDIDAGIVVADLRMVQRHAGYRAGNRHLHGRVGIVRLLIGTNRRGRIAGDRDIGPGVQDHRNLVSVRIERTDRDPTIPIKIVDVEFKIADRVRELPLERAEIAVAICLGRQARGGVDRLSAVIDARHIQIGMGVDAGLMASGISGARVGDRHDAGILHGGGIDLRLGQQIPFEAFARPRKGSSVGIDGVVAEDRVITGAARDGVVAAIAGDQVIARAAIDRIIARATRNSVIAACCADIVIATIAEDHIGPFGDQVTLRIGIADIHELAGFGAVDHAVGVIAVDHVDFVQPLTRREVDHIGHAVGICITIDTETANIFGGQCLAVDFSGHADDVAARAEIAEGVTPAVIGEGCRDDVAA